MSCWTGANVYIEFRSYEKDSELWLGRTSFLKDCGLADYDKGIISFEELVANHNKSIAECEVPLGQEGSFDHEVTIRENDNPLLYKKYFSVKFGGNLRGYGDNGRDEFTPIIDYIGRLLRENKAREIRVDSLVGEIWCGKIHALIFLGLADNVEYVLLPVRN